MDPARRPAAEYSAGTREGVYYGFTMRHRKTALALVVLLMATVAAGSKLPPRAKAPKRPVTDTYWGVRVPDDYQYMEKAKDPTTSKWARGQDRYTRAWLNAHPERKAILNRVVTLTHSDSPDYYKGSFYGATYFFLKEQPPKQQSFLVAMTSVMDTKTERTVMD